MIFEQVGDAEVDMELRCLKIQIDEKIFLIGLRDLEQAVEGKRILPVVQIAEEAPVSQETLNPSNEDKRPS